MGRKKYSEEVKAAVLAALALGIPSAELEQQYKVPAATIRAWKFDQKATPVAIVATQKREMVGELCVDFLVETFRTLQIQVKHFGDLAWLKSQSANEAASLFGTVTDRGFRLLEALEAGAEAEQEQEPPGAVSE
jgi:hypothetical protein